MGLTDPGVEVRHPQPTLLPLDLLIPQVMGHCPLCLRFPSPIHTSTRSLSLY